MMMMRERRCCLLLYLGFISLLFSKKRAGDFCGRDQRPILLQWLHPRPSVNPLPTCDRPHVGDHTTHVRILRPVTGMLTGCRASEGMVAVSCVLLLTALTGCVAMPHHGRIGPTVMRDRVATMGDQLSYLRPRTWRRHDNRRCIDRLPRLNPLNFRPQPPPRYSNPKWNAVWSRTKEGRSKIAERIKREVGNEGKNNTVLKDRKV